MVSDEILLKTLIRTYAYMRRTPSGASDDGEWMTMRTKGFGTIIDVIAGGDGLTQSEIAEAAKMRQQSVSEALASLERQGYIRRVPSSTDRRVSLISITEEGKLVQRRLTAQRRRLAASFFAPLTDEEKDTLHTILCKLGKDFE